jgi:hypothetical protein
VEVVEVLVDPQIGYIISTDTSFNLSVNLLSVGYTNPFSGQGNPKINISQGGIQVLTVGRDGVLTFESKTYSWRDFSGLNILSHGTGTDFSTQKSTAAANPYSDEYQNIALYCANSVSTDNPTPMSILSGSGGWYPYHQIRITTVTLLSAQASSPQQAYVDIYDIEYGYPAMANKAIFTIRKI